MNHSGGEHGPNGYDDEFTRYQAEAIDLSRIAREKDDRPLRELQDLAISEMERIDHQCNQMNRVRVGPYYWITDDQTGALHLACDSAPVETVKILGMTRVTELYEQAKRQERASE